METMSADISKIAIALSKFQGEICLIPKNKTAKVFSQRTNQSFSYSYADLADIWEAIRQPLKNNELALTQFFTVIDSKSFMVTVLCHSSGQWFKSFLELDAHDKIQELGSEITYVRRYALSSILGIATEEDEDGKIANDAEKNGKKAPAPLPIEKAKPTTLTKQQVDTIRSKIENFPEIRQEILNSLGKKSFQEVEYEKFSLVIGMIDLKLKNEGAA